MPPDDPHLAVPHCAECPFRAHLAQFSIGAPDEGVIALRREVRTNSRKVVLYREGETWDDLYILDRGWALSDRLTSENPRQIFNVYLPGDAITLSALRLDSASMTVPALTELVLGRFPRGEMDALRARRHPPHARAGKTTGSMPCGW